jgi:cell division protein FtsA
MVSVTRRILGVTAHLGNPPVEVCTEEGQMAALRRSQYATAAGLLMYSSTIAESLPETEESEVSGFWARTARAISRLSDKIKSFV